MLKAIRKTLAAIFFLGITLIFLDFTGTLHTYLGWMAKIQFLPAVLALNLAVVVALILLTLIMGRIYCSIICPLGIMQDIIGQISSRKKRSPYSYSKEKRILRNIMMIVFIILLVSGFSSLSALLAPYSSFGRIASNLLQPIWILANNGLAYIAESLDSYAFYSADVWIKSLPTFIIALSSFIIIGILAWRNGRTYCNTICPVGTLLSYLARFSWFKIHFDTDKCRSCSKCSTHCKAACIDFRNHSVDYSRCVVCGDCISTCNFNALSYCHTKKNKERKDDDKTGTDSIGNAKATNADKEPVDNSRRSFLLSMAMASSAMALAQEGKKVDGGLAAIEDKVAPKRITPITPPGSNNAKDFAQHCTACQLCISECPNGVLRPSTGLLSIMQPTMSYERGYCRPECTRCSEVCPTGAIKKIDKVKKSSIQIGHAVWIKKNCAVLTDKVECGNCARHCPTGAITMIPIDPKNENSPQIPAINEARCIGCGACEYVCPARPFSAIHVEGNEVHHSI